MHDIRGTGLDHDYDSGRLVVQGPTGRATALISNILSFSQSRIRTPPSCPPIPKQTMETSAVSPEVEVNPSTDPRLRVQVPVPVMIVGEQSLAVSDDQTEEGEELPEGMMTAAVTAYLMTPQGHEIAGRVIGIFEDLKKAALSHGASNAKLEKILQIVIVVTVVVAASSLAAMGKLDSTVGVLFGTLVGYVFGKKNG